MLPVNRSALQDNPHFSEDFGIRNNFRSSGVMMRKNDDFNDDEINIESNRQLFDDAFDD